MADAILEKFIDENGDYDLLGANAIKVSCAVGWLVAIERGRREYFVSAEHATGNDEFSRYWFGPFRTQKIAREFCRHQLSPALADPKCWKKWDRVDARKKAGKQAAANIVG